MKPKYWVPALERAHAILAQIASEPGSLRLIDLATRLDINKSSMFSLLHTMETIGWIVKEKGDTYMLGPALGAFGAAFSNQFQLQEAFRLEAISTVQKIEETVQLGVLDGNQVIYLGKEECIAPIRLVSNPGMRFPAHATALGKVQLAQHDYQTLQQLYPDGQLEERTPFTVKHLSELWLQLQEIHKLGYAFDREEAVQGFFCIAAPIFNHEGRIIGAVSVSMVETSWKEKWEMAIREILQLALRISSRAGFVRKGE
ncbi:IclR family transcriptional regulator [Fodinisporobacter ferrooxydans]|uniref:IclR family transcriptional regulator n=1 Tax=Fodinisporobacter ferrooxydans TaxID=2901836 RepID=A0ABY4CX16_9BACL|nr:IclR family transcriptional regulator [Alicyclobacillaceae bacterium MYW30-H2]